MTGFQPATKKQAKLRMALIGPAGSGKTYTALKVGTALGKKVALIDTEHGSASKYADQYTFDTQELHSFSPTTYVTAIAEAASAGYDVLVIDSLSHAWMGKDGALEQVDRRGGKFQAWRDVTPMHNALVEAILQSPMHIIVTLRSKTAYAADTDEKGKMTVTKVGLAPIQRDGVEYEFDVTADLDLDNNLHVSKTRCSALAGEVIPKPGAELAATLAGWLGSGEAPEPPASTAERKKLTRVLADLGKVDDKTQWETIAGKWTEREFGCTVDAATSSQIKQAVEKFTDHLAKLKAAANGDEAKAEEAAPEPNPESQFKIPEAAKA